MPNTAWPEDGELKALSACPAPTQERSPVILMVSGGSDSTALLVRAATGEIDLRDGDGPRAIDPARLVALHVNHLIRGEASDGDEAFVADLCGRLGVELRVVRADVPALVRGASRADERNLEEVARRVRYGAAWDLACELCARRGVVPQSARVLVAHTADDRAETFLMRVITGAGLTGLVGLRPTCGIVVRPLLGQTREELREELRERGIGWREDATNEEDVALRSYVRHHVTPAMARRNPSFARTLGRTLDHLADEDELLARLAAGLLDQARRQEAPRPGADPATRHLALDAVVIAAAEPALARRALRLALGELLGAEGLRRARVEARHVEWLLGLACEGAGEVTLPLGVRASCEGGLLRLAEPACGEGRRGGASGQGDGAEGAGLAQVALPVPGEATWGDALITAELVEVPDGRDVAEFARACALQDCVPAAGWRGLPASRCVATLDAWAAGVGRGGALVIRGPRPGERMQPLGMGGHSRLVHDLLMEARVPADERARMPLVCVAGLPCAEVAPGERSHLCARRDEPETRGISCDGVVWVAGIRADERAAYDKRTHLLLRLAIVPLAI